MRKNWDGPQKAQVRTWAMPSSPKENTIWLPGYRCHCFREAIDKGMVVPNGQHWLVERSPETAQAIRKAVIDPCDWDVPPKLFPGELHHLQVATAVDYAFFDFTGGLTQEVAQWLHKLPLAEGADVVFTLAYGWRFNKFMETCKDTLLDGDYLYKLSVELGISDKNVLVYLATLMAIFDGYDYEVAQPIKYVDTINSMVAYRLSNLTPSKDCSCLLSLLLLERRVGMPAKTARKRKEAAKKAWETRRQEAEELAAKRSAAARKAWKTRRKQAAATK